MINKQIKHKIQFTKVCVRAFKSSFFRSTRCLRFSYVTSGNWHHPQRIIARICVRISMATNGVVVSVWCRGCAVGGVESDETAILQSTSTLCYIFPFLL